MNNMTHTSKEENHPLNRADFMPWSAIPLSPPLGKKEALQLSIKQPQLTQPMPSTIWSQPAGTWSYTDIPQRTRSSSVIPLPLTSSLLDQSSSSTEDYFTHHDKSTFPSPLFPSITPNNQNSIWSFDYSSMLQHQDQVRRHSVAVLQSTKPLTPPPQMQKQQQQQIDEYFSPTTALMDVQCLGKGKLLEELSGQQKIYQVQFKQTFDYFYVQQEDLHFQLNDRVIVEGDRGYDLGRVVGLSDKTNTPTDRVKRLFRHANSAELITYEQKGYDEQKALTLCQSKIKQKNLDMKIIDAEYQWDRRKLTFYFKANERVDFRELVKELFKIYKTRIWMCAYSPNEK